MTTHGKKTPAQLDREIEAVVPGWARGLDMTESKRIAATLHRSQEDLDRKQRVYESTRQAALPALRIEAHSGKEPGSNTPRGIFVWVNSPGIAYANVRHVADILRSAGENVKQFEPRYVKVAAGTDLQADVDRLTELFRGRGYRVTS